jgi:23S rRNA pseudouridine955/2504/2580 synthase
MHHADFFFTNTQDCCMMHGMKSFIVSSNLSGQKLVRAVCQHFPGIRPAVVLKALENKDIRINGKRTSGNLPVREGDTIAIFLPDLLFDNPVVKPESKESRDYLVVFEDESVLVVHKPSGLAVHSGKSINGHSLIELVRKDRSDPNLTLCHRLDMNTGGLLLIAKNKKTAETITKALKAWQIHKRYRCLVRGIPQIGDKVRCYDGAAMYELKAYLEKRPNKPEVFIHDHPLKGDLDIITRYRVLQILPEIGPKGEDISELEVELVTGRTHQIRAHLAHIGHPLLGDGKYGRNAYNKHFRSQKGRLKSQQLYATSLYIEKSISSGPIRYLAGQSFKIDPIYDLQDSLLKPYKGPKFRQA